MGSEMCIRDRPTGAEIRISGVAYGQSPVSISCGELQWPSEVEVKYPGRQQFLSLQVDECGSVMFAEAPSPVPSQKKKKTTKASRSPKSSQPREKTPKKSGKKPDYFILE